MLKPALVSLAFLGGCVQPVELTSRDTLSPLLSAPSAVDAAKLPLLLVDRDNIEVTQSCRLRFGEPVADRDGNGVVHVATADVYVDLGGETLTGAASSMDASGGGAAAANPAHAYFQGIGISITAPRVRLGGGAISGFRVAVLADVSHGSVLEDLDLSGNFAQALTSDFEQEWSSDWLFPHENDAQEWRQNFGAGLCIQSSDRVTVRRVKVRRTQNGVILDRVTNAQVYDNDCSFLSGWGVALWRSSDNTICRNYFDFCLRGYSHGVYSRGQDSAGILLFEQCCRNTIALNSATHCGDGLFGFAGQEALGASSSSGAAKIKRAGLGCNLNRIEWNDFSFAAAHGMEMTFSFGNMFERNRCVSNAICGLWGGYCHESLVRANLFMRNGEVASGDEHGGINIEHGRSNHIEGNLFRRDTRGIRLWDDSDPALASTAWATANGSDGGNNSIASNEFVELPVAVQIDAQPGNCVGANVFTDVPLQVVTDQASKVGLRSDCQGITAAQGYAAITARLPGATNPVKLSGDWPESTRAQMGGRDVMLIHDNFPVDPDTPTLVRTRRSGAQETWRLIGSPLLGAQVSGTTQASVAMSSSDNSITVFMEDAGTAGRYQLDVRTRNGEKMLLHGSGAIAPAEWGLRVFPLEGDPIADPPSFAKIAAKTNMLSGFQDLRFLFGGDGPTELGLVPSGFPVDGFGIQATSDITFPAGCWMLVFRSDDGLRVRLDGATIIDRWDRHAATDDRFLLELTEPALINLEVDYFELDGAATLLWWVESCSP
ncbi:MAG: hypothetical protein EXS00_02715 [Phycisphaerales bacterium]|nr:hypothetical protein [Phycisphaerales bacterium]